MLGVASVAVLLWLVVSRLAVVVVPLVLTMFPAGSLDECWCGIGYRRCSPSYWQWPAAVGSQRPGHRRDTYPVAGKQYQAEAIGEVPTDTSLGRRFVSIR
jgi:hypothetical protein